LREFDEPAMTVPIAQTAEEREVILHDRNILECWQWPLGSIARLFGFHLIASKQRSRLRLLAAVDN
jgi:hypothetical protein